MRTRGFLCKKSQLLNCFKCAHQAPLSLGFSRQKYWSELPCPSPGDLPYPRIEAGSPAMQADSLPSDPPEIQNINPPVKKPSYKSLSSRAMLPVLVATRPLHASLPDILPSVPHAEVKGALTSRCIGRPATRDHCEEGVSCLNWLQQADAAQHPLP